MKKLMNAAVALAFFLIPVLVAAQTEPVDLEMIYKIKQYEKSKSQIEELSFWMTDFLGPRLTASGMYVQTISSGKNWNPSASPMP